MSIIRPKFKKTQKKPKNPIKPNKTQKNPPGWFFKKKPGFLPTLFMRADYTLR
jgi:hypothetical protein